MKKNVLSVVFIFLLTIGLTSCTNLPSDKQLSAEAETQSSKEEKILWEGTAYLDNMEYCNITGANNVFSDELVITSSNNNPATVKLRIIDGKSAMVGDEKTVAPGEEVTMDKIPALSGTYTIQGLADVSGHYIFTIK